MIEFGKFFGPMLLTEKSRAFDDEDYIYELKYDGIRAIVHVDRKSIRIYSRNGVEISGLYPELKSIQGLVKGEVIFDGELVRFREGVPDFKGVAKRNRLRDTQKIKYASLNEPVTFVAFDILYEGGDLTGKTLIERKKILEGYKENEYFLKTEYIEGKGKKLFSKVCEAGLEGIVAKRKDSLYSVGTRSTEWIKIKNFKEEDFVVGGYVDNKVKCSLLLGEYRRGKLYYVGKVSISKNSSQCKELWKMDVKKANPFVNCEEKGAKYFNPKRKARVSYIERTESGNLRQPVFKKFIE